MSGGLARSALVLALVLGGAGAARAAAPVHTQGGALQGIDAQGVTAYLGIPYAVPPVGVLRWRPPQGLPHWSGVRTADHFGNDCMQGRRPGTPEATHPTSEDCLYLNVWAPPAGKQPHPVLMWVHGGAFVVGSASQPLYDGASLARRGVVVVTLNYRLGRFGFFAHPALAGEGGGANFGLLDQIKALRWVRGNIAAFGADAHAVTLAGQSAGGASVADLMVSPLARGLYDRAIIESGIMRNPPTTLAEARAEAETAVSTTWGVSGKVDAAALRGLPAEVVLGRGPPLAVRAGPIIDGAVLPQDVFSAFAAGHVPRVPLLIGSNSYEAGFFRSRADGLAQRYAAEWRHVTQVFDGYGTHRTSEIEGELATDQLITGPTWQVARDAARAGLPTYLYYFAYVRPSERGRMPGASHIDEVYALFDQMGSVEPHPDASTARIIDEVQSRWAEFARTGAPGAGWPRLRPQALQVLQFDNQGVRVRGEFARARLELADQLARHAAPPGG